MKHVFIMFSLLMTTQAFAATSSSLTKYVNFDDPAMSGAKKPCYVKTAPCGATFDHKPIHATYERSRTNRMNQRMGAGSII